RLDDVRSAPHAPVHEDWHVVTDGVGNRWQQVDRRWHGIELASAVVGHDDRIDPLLRRQPGIFWMGDAFERDPEPRDPAEPLDMRPGELWPEHEWMRRTERTARKGARKRHAHVLAAQTGRQIQKAIPQVALAPAECR